MPAHFAQRRRVALLSEARALMLGDYHNSRELGDAAAAAAARNAPLFVSAV